MLIVQEKTQIFSLKHDYVIHYFYMPKRRKKKKNPLLRDTLAIERTELSNERTFYACIRTGLTLFVVGITMLKLLEDPFFKQIAWLFIAASFVFIFIGFFHYLSNEKAIKRVKN